jgi:hypothetical protein
MIIYMSDIRKAKMCAKGARAFFLRQGWDFSDFLKNGIDSELVRSCNDAMANQVLKAVEDGRK